jgi:hypothetical protein
LAAGFLSGAQRFSRVRRSYAQMEGNCSTSFEVPSTISSLSAAFAGSTAILGISALATTAAINPWLLLIAATVGAIATRDAISVDERFAALNQLRILI